MAGGFALGIADARSYNERMMAAYQQIMQVNAMQQAEVVKAQFALQAHLAEQQQQIESAKITAGAGIQKEMIQGKFNLAKEEMSQTGQDRRMFYEQQQMNIREYSKLQEDMQKSVFQEEMNNKRSAGNNQATVTAATINAQSHVQASLNSGSASLISSMLSNYYTPQQALLAGEAYKNNLAPSILGLLGTGPSPKAQLEAQRFTLEARKEQRLQEEHQIRYTPGAGLEWLQLKEEHQKNQATSLGTLSHAYDNSIKAASALETGMFGPLAVGPDGKKLANPAAEAQIASQLSSMARQVSNGQMDQKTYHDQAARLLVNSQFSLARWQPYLAAVAQRDFLASQVSGSYGNAIAALPSQTFMDQVHANMSPQEQQGVLGWMTSTAGEMLWNIIPGHDYINHVVGSPTGDLDYGNAFSNAVFQKTGQSPDAHMWTEFQAKTPEQKFSILKSYTSDPEVKDKRMLENITQTYDINNPSADKLLTGFKANTQLGEKGWFGTNQADFGVLGDAASLLGGGILGKFVHIPFPKFLTWVGAKQTALGVGSKVFSIPGIKQVSAYASSFGNNWLLRDFASASESIFGKEAGQEFVKASPWAQKAASYLPGGTEDAGSALSNLFKVPNQISSAVGENLPAQTATEVWKQHFEVPAKPGPNNPLREGLNVPQESASYYGEGLPLAEGPESVKFSTQAFGPSNPDLRVSTPQFAGGDAPLPFNGTTIDPTSNPMNPKFNIPEFENLPGTRLGSLLAPDAEAKMAAIEAERVRFANPFAVGPNEPIALPGPNRIDPGQLTDAEQAMLGFRVPNPSSPITAGIPEVRGGLAELDPWAVPGIARPALNPATETSTFPKAVEEFIAAHVDGNKPVFSKAGKISPWAKKLLDENILTKAEVDSMKEKGEVTQEVLLKLHKTGSKIPSASLKSPLPGSPGFQEGQVGRPQNIFDQNQLGTTPRLMLPPGPEFIPRVRPAGPIPRTSPNYPGTPEFEESLPPSWYGQSSPLSMVDPGFIGGIPSDMVTPSVMPIPPTQWGPGGAQYLGGPAGGYRNNDSDLLRILMGER